MNSPDSLILAALVRLPDAMAQRCMIEVTRWLDHCRTVHSAASRGVHVAPLYRLPVHEQMQRESDRRAALGDRTWIVWDAWSASLRGASTGRGGGGAIT